MRLLSRLKLYLAGWRPNRNVWSQLTLPAEFELFPAAQRVLTEYGRLAFHGDDGSRITLDPEVVRDLFPAIHEFSKRLKLPLYPIGECDGHDGIAIAIDDSGRCYYVFVDELRPAGSTFENALDILVGRRLRRSDIAARNGMPALKLDGPLPWDP